MTKYSVGKDNKRAHERPRGQSCNRPVAQFGEYVMYLLRGSPSIDDNNVCNEMCEGIWLGIADRTE